jgi:hypothetical protein
MSASSLAAASAIDRPPAFRLRSFGLAPKALHHGVAPAPVAASTTMVPVICGCKEQKYSYVPGVVNVNVNLSSVSSGLDLNCLVVDVTVCGMSS